MTFLQAYLPTGERRIISISMVSTHYYDLMSLNNMVSWLPSALPPAGMVQHFFPLHLHLLMVDVGQEDRAGWTNLIYDLSSRLPLHSVGYTECFSCSLRLPFVLLQRRGILWEVLGAFA